MVEIRFLWCNKYKSPDWWSVYPSDLALMQDLFPALQYSVYSNWSLPIYLFLSSSKILPICESVHGSGGDFKAPVLTLRSKNLYFTKSQQILSPQLNLYKSALDWTGAFQISHRGKPSTVVGTGIHVLVQLGLCQ